MTLVDQTSKQELRVPKPVRELVRAIVMTAFLLFFVFLGICNLFNRVAIIPSALWLLLIGAWLTGLCREKGIRRLATDHWGNFSLNQFIQTIRHEGGNNEIQFGYQAFGCRFLYFSIRVDKIEMVNWKTGQASSMTGRDMNDWSVAIWYDHGDPAKSQKKIKWNHPDQDVYIVGPMGQKQETAAFGHAVVTFLRNSGATLVPGNNDCTFVRT